MPSAFIENVPPAVQAKFTASKYSDLTVLCGNDKYLLHRAIVCPRSKFFDAACDGGFKEASTATIHLPDDDPQAVNRMLIYIYTNDYPEGLIQANQQPARVLPPKPPHLRLLSSRPSESLAEANLVPTDTPAKSTSLGNLMLSNVRTYAIADKYDVLGLKKLAIGRVSNLADKFSANLDTENLNAIIRTVFNCTASGERMLQDIVINICSNNIDKITEHPVMTETVQDIGALSLGIISSLRKREKLALQLVSDSESFRQLNVSDLKAEHSKMAKQNIMLEASNKELGAARHAAEFQLKEATSGKEKALKMKDFAINQRNGIIEERDAALNRYAICVAQLDEYLSNAEVILSCKNCHVGFNAYLKRYGGEEHRVRMVLRCGMCGCRHDIGAGRGP